MILELQRWSAYTNRAACWPQPNSTLINWKLNQNISRILNRIFIKHIRWIKIKGSIIWLSNTKLLKKVTSRDCYQSLNLVKIDCQIKYNNPYDHYPNNHNSRINQNN